MKRIFISQPMRDKTDAEIIAERKEAVRLLQKYYGEEIEVLDSFFEGAPHDARPLWFLGKSFEILSQADIAYFCKGWQNYNGCNMEHMACIEYGIQVIEA